MKPSAVQGIVDVPVHHSRPLSLSGVARGKGGYISGRACEEDRVLGEGGKGHRWEERLVWISKNELAVLA